MSIIERAEHGVHDAERAVELRARDVDVDRMNRRALDGIVAAAAQARVVLLEQRMKRHCFVGDDDLRAGPLVRYVGGDDRRLSGRVRRDDVHRRLVGAEAR